MLWGFPDIPSDFAGMVLVTDNCSECYLILELDVQLFQVDFWLLP